MRRKMYEDCVPFAEDDFPMIRLEVSAEGKMKKTYMLGKFCSAWWADDKSLKFLREMSDFVIIEWKADNLLKKKLTWENDVFEKKVFISFFSNGVADMIMEYVSTALSFQLIMQCNIDITH